eukprot:TRINITY_DN703_c0_g1_i1.p1 TRINITY_DN703_c0_g1~~TRINITY_DN703_c0_g1_i1.p1  ORF type:complete len:281 (-),score=49.70 TRINITY_DN703_c0_g1_i1:24-866(-)
MSAAFTMMQHVGIFPAVYRNCRYDHHQKSFTDSLDEDHEIRLSSAGLVFKHFGWQIIQDRIGCDDDTTDVIFMKVYNGFVEALDAIDNGVSQYPSEIEPAYRSSTDLSARIGRLNPEWNDPAPDPDRMFQKAMQIAGEEFFQFVDFYGKVWLPARLHVEKALFERERLHPSGQIICMEIGCPWTEHFFELETELELGQHIKYVLFPDTSGSWRVRAVPIHSGAFENRRALPASWRALREADLDKVVGVDGCIFVHATGFIGGHRTQMGALQMAINALTAE